MADVSDVVTSYCLLLESGDHILLETGADCIATEEIPFAADVLLLEDGFALLLEDGNLLFTEG